MAKKQTYLTIKGANQHNLKNVDVKIAHKSLTVVTGVSGSGKSSLVMDTIFAEGQRRYVESLSSYARQFLGRIKKPEVDFINGLAPAIAIEQKVNTRNSRSTVATSTEIYDYLKLLFARIGKTISPISGKVVKKDTTKDVIAFCEKLTEKEKIYVLAPIADTKKGLIKNLMQRGYIRIVLKNGDIERLEDLSPKNEKQITDIAVDRLVISQNLFGEDNRLADSIELAFWEGQGTCYILTEDGKRHKFSNKFELDGMHFEEPSTSFLSFNNPHGACKTCEGFGQVLGIDPDLVVPNKNLSLYDDAVMPWRSPAKLKWKIDFIEKSSNMNFPIHRSYSKLNKNELDLLWNGNTKGVKGIYYFFKKLEEKYHKIQNRVMVARYRGKTGCPDCNGTRLRKDAAYIKIIPAKGSKTQEKLSIKDVLLMNIEEANAYFSQLKLDNNDAHIAKQLLQEIQFRLEYLNKVGLNYLQLNRLSNTLSGGESQRINLATSLGSSLVGSIYILDEPSIGLHPKDTERLIEVIKGLQQTGNTVIIVEHDEDIMRAADHIIDMGPEAGYLGGEVVTEGTLAEIIKQNKSLTAQYLSNAIAVKVPSPKRNPKHFINIKGASENNLKGIDVSFPLECFTAVTGVSGSGKTTLVKQILYPAVQKKLENYTRTKTGSHESIDGSFHLVDAVEMVDQNPIGRTSRSNPVTYVKAYDAIRDLYGNLPLSKSMKYTAGSFSFNVDGGRCDACTGEGETTVEMQFMADIKLTCESCNGKRFKKDLLEVEYKGKNISDVLNMTVEQAVNFFADDKNIAERLQPLMDVGLNYVKLGQSSSTLSGGEAQRVKLAYFLSKTSPNKRKHTLYIFDEPTTGLHFHDINKLLTALYALVDKGNSVIVIEHNIDMIKCADYVIDLGPGGGNKGGSLVYQGSVEGLVKNKKTFTGKYLKGKV